VIEVFLAAQLDGYSETLRFKIVQNFGLRWNGTIIASEINGGKLCFPITDTDNAKHENGQADGF